jgi:cob(I)alamin adenosyltransferase
MYYTGDGDKGTYTILNSKTRLEKSSPIFGLLGDLDELNSYLGLCSVEAFDFLEIQKDIKDIQHNLFIIQACFAKANVDFPITALNKTEERIKEIALNIEKRESFVLSGGSRLSSTLDIARAIARRAERRAVGIRNSYNKEINPTIFAYLNRLSSLLYVLARLANDLNSMKEEAPNYDK